MNEALAILCGVWFLASLALGYLVYLQRQEMNRAAWRWENSGHILSIFRPFGKFEKMDYKEFCASRKKGPGRGPGSPSENNLTPGGVTAPPWHLFPGAWR